ncbi:fatty acyl-AMP ligase [Nakamurella flavida]|uniref:Fatty acyl-AMP ligase n=1 Tax=Nakamurella flavida TaxID=363630 RepID=A0A939C6K8_9ACTN|nr:fatty acyl-AMP ligase [Nakamurella flavida]MBM9477287.1 fatty acyl-AMP ligase [Nakamurella flavida]MDP9779743.1 fatty-acyl-CoA synthase [Nakamurella flavida]
MSAFTDALIAVARGTAGMTTGEPREPVRTSFADLHARARVGAGALRDRGLRPGDAVAVMAGAPVQVAPAAQAAWLAGASVTMLHQPTARTDLSRFAVETASVLRVVRARVVLLGAPFTHLLPMLLEAGIDAVTVDDLLSGPAPEEPLPADRPGGIGEELPALLQLTSGSTATPKAVRITHRNVWANIDAMCESAAIVPGQVMVSWLPLFHDMGMIGFLTLPQCRGIEVVLVTPQDFLSSPLLWLELIDRYRGTLTAAPNFAYALAARVLARAEGLDLSSLRFALNGAEPIDATAVRAFLAAGERFGLPSTAVVCAYGMAEATLGVSFHPWGTPLAVDTVLAADLEERRVAVPVEAGDRSEDAATRAFPLLGPPLRGIEVAVLGEGGRVLGDREVGTLHLRGESVTEEYLTVDGPVATRDARGWLDTGDLGYLVDGRVVVCGRVKDVIIMGGRNIHPTDIERVAGQVDGVRAGNAVAVRWTASGGRESFAVAVESRAAGDPAEVERISAGIRSAVTTAIGARPATVTVLPVGSLPKTPSGKLRRAAARELITPA